MVKRKAQLLQDGGPSAHWTFNFCPERHKTNHPKDAIGVNKVPVHLFPGSAIVYGSMGLMDGRGKYGQDNYRAVGVRASIYAAALCRHILDWFDEGLDVDPDSGLHPLCHILADAAILVEAMTAGKLTDDRKLPGGYLTALKEMTPHVQRIREKYAYLSPHHYSIADKDSKKD